MHTTALQISYTSGSLTLPERVEFRYKLEGLDKEWQDGDHRRDAFYTNLGPGRYTFHVIGSNNDGVWNEVGASLRFTIEPAWYQAVWFRVVVVALVAVLCWLAIRWRLRAVHGRMRARLEERMAERERIARELHDTFLQSVHGLILKFQSAAQRLPVEEPARELIERSLDHADQVLVEGRDRVSALRSLGASRELSLSLREMGEELARGTATCFQITVEGRERSLNPFIGDELYRIGAEALTNAYRHARASLITVDISYGARDVCLRIADNGLGFQTERAPLADSRSHWGLTGMHERASKIHAAMNVESRPGAGTSVEITVRNSIAFKNAARDDYGPMAARV